MTIPSPTALPQATPILAYGTQSSAGGVIRSKAAEAVRLWGHWISGIGVAAFDLAVLIVIAVVLDRFLNWDPLSLILGMSYQSRWWGAARPDVWEILGEVVRTIWPLVPTAALFFAYGFILRILAKPVDRDSKGACWAALWLISPWTIFFAAAALASIVLAIGYGTPLFQTGPQMSTGYLLLFVVAAVAAWLLVLTTRTSYRLLCLARSTGEEVIPLETAAFVDPNSGLAEAAFEDPALPKVRALNYLGRINTQTKVRVVTARGVLSLGVVCGTVSAIMLIGFIIDFLHVLVPWAAGINVRAFIDAFGITAGSHPLEFILGAVFFPGILFAFFSPLVRRGSIPGCIFCLLFTIVLIVALFLVIPVLTCLLLLYMNIGLPNPHYALGFWLLLLPVAVVVILLLKDIAACLFWIVRHPSLEKAPVHFISRPHPVS